MECDTAVCMIATTEMNIAGGRKLFQNRTLREHLRICPKCNLEFVGFLLSILKRDPSISRLYRFMFFFHDDPRVFSGVWNQFWGFREELSERSE